MGRLHVPETRTDPAIAEMDLREGREDRWSSWSGGFGLLSRVVPLTSLSPVRHSTSKDPVANTVVVHFWPLKRRSLTRSDSTRIPTVLPSLIAALFSDVF